MSKRIPLPVIAGSVPRPSDPGPVPVTEAAASGNTRATGGTVMEEIEHEVKNNPILVYMKGTRQRPECGFSNRVVQIMEQIGKPFHTVNILVDPEKRQAIKTYSEWPTIPQVYVNGEFLGGSDIVYEMYQSGELAETMTDV